MANPKLTNPWAGLSSYQDPSSCEKPLLFCGRDNESYDVAHLIDENLFVTLYGRSGTGKTSLLNAGVFPLLRKEGYLPIRVRPGTDAKDTSLQQCLIDQINRAMDGVGFLQTWPVVPMPDDRQAPEYLWSFFARTRFIDKEGEVLFPVLVLDQFEEILRWRPEDTEILLRQLYYMMDKGHALEDRLVGGQPYTYDFNFRFVVAIREDELYRLEDCIDNNYLPEMKSCRFRLRNLTEEGAREVILKPSKGLFKTGAFDSSGGRFQRSEDEIIADRIIASIQRSDTRDKRVSTVALSLICSRIFVYFQQQPDLPYVNLELVERFIGGDPFENYYREATRSLSSREKAYLETHLVDLDERRKTVPEQELKDHIRNADTLLEGEMRLLQRASTEGSGSRVELIHDSFCRPLLEMKKKREKRELRKKWAGRLVMLLLVGVVIFAQQKRFMGQKLDDQEQLNKALIREKFNDTDSTATVNGPLIVDGIRYDVVSPSEEQIAAWSKEFYQICADKVKELMKQSPYDVPSDMLHKYPTLVYLVLNSESIPDHQEKQSWFDLYPMMNDSQIYQLYEILYREAYRLASINAKYETRKAEIQEKYKD